MLICKFEVLFYVLAYGLQMDPSIRICELSGVGFVVLAYGLRVIGS